MEKFPKKELGNTVLPPRAPSTQMSSREARYVLSEGPGWEFPSSAIPALTGSRFLCDLGVLGGEAVFYLGRATMTALKGFFPE